jgi:quinol monooxygenase YgiN
MYASVRKYRVEPEHVAELMSRVDQTFAPKIAAVPGFTSYQAIDCGNGIVITVSSFADEAGADASAETAAQFVTESLADLEVDRLEAAAGEVAVNR